MTCGIQGEPTGTADGTGSAPNIVLIQADQLAADALGTYGNRVVQSPHIDDLGATGAVFDRAYCNSPLCAPSRASMMTGRLPSEIDCHDNGDDFSASVPTVAHHLRALGYHTTLIGRMHFVGPDQHHGFEERLTTDVYPADLDMVPDWRLDAGERLPWYHEADSVFTAGVCRATVQQDFDDEVTFRTLRHLNDRVRADRARGQRTPFLLVTSFIHPHDPYEPPREHWDRYEDVPIDAPRHPDPPPDDPHTQRLRAMSGFDVRPPDEAQTLRARRAYYAAVSYIDDQVGRILARLEDLGLAEDTVVIITSDHGDLRGEKGLWYKMSPYEQSVRVPLLIHGPEHLVPHGRFDTPVSLLDLLPTVVALAGGDDQGPSLPDLARREAAGDPVEEREVVIEYLAEGVVAPHVTLVRGTEKFIRCPGDPDQLFDLAADPDELVNLADRPDRAEQVAGWARAVDERYDLAALAERVRASQARRRLVSRALATGKVRHWDLDPDPEQRYVRGDFWAALDHGKIVDPDR
ncbi:MAG: choline-sulfatase [Propionibacteriaceae bacterium]